MLLFLTSQTVLFPRRHITINVELCVCLQLIICLFQYDTVLETK